MYVRHKRTGIVGEVQAEQGETLLGVTLRTNRSFRWKRTNVVVLEDHTLSHPKNYFVGGKVTKP